MPAKLGIRREDKNKWEKRVPLVPEHLAELQETAQLQFVVQPSTIRVFSDADYQKAGAKVQEDLNDCSIVFGVKEMPLSFFEPEKTYLFFSHTIKGQEQNMPLLKRLMELKCNLVDYEKIANDQGTRLVMFGKHAGLAGAIESLNALAKRLRWEGYETPLTQIQHAYQYHDLEEAKEAIKAIGKQFAPCVKELTEKLGYPINLAIAGDGNTSKGAQEIFDLLPIQQVDLKEVPQLDKTKNPLNLVVMSMEDMMHSKDTTASFELQDYFKNPASYACHLEKYLPFFTLFLNCIYWDLRYPRLITKSFLKNNFPSSLKLKIIGDISCDLNGAVECTSRITSPEDPVYCYNPLKDQDFPGYKGEGIVIMAVDNLPCELPRDASNFFSQALKSYLTEMAQADYSVPFEELSYSETIKRAVILYHGELTPEYYYLQKYL